MIDVNKLNIDDLLSINISTIRTNKKIEYLNIESAFDIETTSIKLQGGEKSAFMYIWMFGIGYGEKFIMVEHGKNLLSYVNYYNKHII